MQFYRTKKIINQDKKYIGGILTVQGDGEKHFYGPKMLSELWGWWKHVV